MSSEQAYSDLTKLEMKGDKIDNYVATFQNLIVRAGWECGARGSLKMFKQGLQRGIHFKILFQDCIP
jgi:hypothetical protein